MAARLAAENAEFMLYPQDLCPACVDRIGGAVIGGDVVLGDQRSYVGPISFDLSVIHCIDIDARRGRVPGQGEETVFGISGKATASRREIAQQGDMRRRSHRARDGRVAGPG